MNRKRPPEQRPRATGTPSKARYSEACAVCHRGRVPFSYGYDHDHHDHSSDPIFSALRSFYNSKTSSRPSHSMWPLPVIHITSDMANLFVPVSHWRRLNKSVPQILLSHLSTTQSFDRGALRDLQFCFQLSLEDGSVHSTHQSQNYTSMANQAHPRLLLFSPQLVLRITVACQVD